MIAFLKRSFSGFNGAALAFAGTVALGVLPSLWRGSIDPRSARGAWCLALAFAYALIGMLNFAACGLVVKAWRRVLFVAVEGALLFWIFFLTRFHDQIYLCVFPLVVVGVILFLPAAAAVVVVLLFALIAGMQRTYWGVDSSVSFLTAMLPAFAFVVLFTLIAAREKAARARAEALTAEVDRLAVIRERNRLAREIHDSLGHFLTTIHVQLEAARAIHASDPDRALEAVAKAQELARDALVEVRRSVGSLRADMIPTPLATRLRDLASVTDGWGAAVSLEIFGEARTLPPEAEHALFRATQEGLTNVRKHARARTARVTLDYRDPARVFVRVCDDGCGAGGDRIGRGLAGLRERIAVLGGRVVAENQPSGGFGLQVEIPA